MSDHPKSINHSRKINRKQFIRIAGLGSVGMATFIACGKNPVGSSDEVESEALLFCIADLHSPHNMMPRILAAIESKLGDTTQPALILINGDVFERANTVALLSAGAIEWAFLERLQELAQVVVNIGNHEGALTEDLREVVNEMKALEIQVISNIHSQSTNESLAETHLTLELNNMPVRIIGIATDDLFTYREVHRQAWVFPDAQAYAQQHVPSLMITDGLTILMDHDGVVSDRPLFEMLPEHSLLLGGHDHVRFIEAQNNKLALHTGWWGATVDVVKLQITDNKPGPFSMETITLNQSSQADPQLLSLVEQTEQSYLTQEESEVMAVASSSQNSVDTMLFCVESLRDASDADAVCINNTTFGAPIEAGPVRRHELNAIIRFDGSLVRAIVPGSILITIMEITNQFNLESWNQSTGEYCIADFPQNINPDGQYSLAVNIWTALNQERFLGTSGIEFDQDPSVPSIREAVAAGIV